MGERIKRITGSLYWRQFMLTAGMVVLTMALLGVSFYALSYNYTVSEKRQEMQDRAVLVAQLSVDYFTAGDDAERDQGDALRSLAGVASRMTDVDFLICDTTGSVLLTTDADLAGKTVVVPEDITQTVLGSERLYEGRSTVGVYEKKQFVVGVPMTDADGNTLGLVLAVMNSAELTQMWRSFIALFFMSSAIILVLAFITSFVTAMRQIQPLSEMVKATRAYAGGDFDVRMQETGDCGEISELAAAFNAMADSLQETERQRRDFIANVSHELKTPMTTIAGYTDGILDGTIPPERQSHYLHIVSDEVKRLSRLVRTMLNLSRIDNGELKLRPNDFDISETVLSTVLTFEKSIDEKKIDIRGLDTLQPMQVHGDEDLLHQVVYNLVENAVKFTNTEGYISFNVSDSIDRIVVTIENSGSGIQSDELPLVFEKFYKTDKSRSQDKNGMGLGLFLVRTIIKLHGGDISVSSVVNEYTRFSFYIPKPQEPPKLKYNTGSIPVTVPVEDAVISERPKKEHHGHKDNKEPDQK